MKKVCALVIIRTLRLHIGSIDFQEKDLCSGYYKKVKTTYGSIDFEEKDLCSCCYKKVKTTYWLK